MVYFGGLSVLIREAKEEDGERGVRAGRTCWECESGLRAATGALRLHDT